MTELAQKAIASLPINTLQDAMAYFSLPENCIAMMISVRWPNGVMCPTCGSSAVTFLPTRQLFQCKARHPKRQFSVKVGTVFEDSPIFLGKWLIAMWMLVSCRNGLSSHELARTIGVTQKSAWFMLHRLRHAMQDTTSILSGEVEMDETYMGGKAKNKHVGKRGGVGRDPRKVPVFGMVERGGKVIAAVVPDAREKNILPIVQERVSKEATVYTDDFPIYDKLKSLNYTHQSIAHSRDRYVKGRVHTNTIENFWSVLKRNLRGTYITVTRKHLMAYVAEQMFRFNQRKTPGEMLRFGNGMSGVAGKRLTYLELTSR